MTNREAAEIMKAIIFMLKNEDYSDEVEEAIHMAINALTAQPETHEKRTETHSCDCVERAAAQTELMMKCERYTLARESHGMGHVEWSSDLISVADAMDAIRGLPSAQPEIIRCNECKNWLDIDDGRQKHRMCADIYGEWYCADAERRTDDKTNKGSSC